MKPPRILIIQTAFLGDVILTTPLAGKLADTLSGSDIDFMTIPASVNLIETHPGIRSVIVFDKRGRHKGLTGLLKMGAKVRGEAYDICICPHRSLRSAWLAYRTGAPVRIGFNTSAWGGAFTQLVPYRKDIHEIERNLSLLVPLGINAGMERPRVYPDANDQQVAARLLQAIAPAPAGSLFAVAPGSVWATKRWPQRYYAEICRMLAAHGWQPVLIGGAGDRALCDEIIRAAGAGASAAGKLTLRQTGALLARCRGLLTNDSAPLHLGMAFDIPVFAVFGPTVPAFGFGPFGAKGHIIEHTGLACRPCSIHGGKKCPVKTFDCMEYLKPDGVFRKILGYFANEHTGA